jgi:hypothetical protein
LEAEEALASLSLTLGNPIAGNMGEAWKAVE